MNRLAAWLSVLTLGVLVACSAPSPTTPPTPAGQAAVDIGARLYEGNCSACHQADAHGVPGVYPSLSGSPVVLGDPQALALWIVEGRRPPAMPAGRYPTVMAQFGWLKPGDAAALLTYLRASFGNAAPSVDAATVAHALDSPT